MSTAGSSSGGSAARMVGRVDRRQVALHVDDDLGPAVGIDRPHRLVDAVGAGGMIGAGHHRLAASGLHGGRDLGRIGGDHHPADPGLLGPPQHVDDHRQAADVGSGLPGRRVAAMRAGISTRMRVSVIRNEVSRPRKRAGNNGDRRKVGALIRVARARANRYLNPAEGAARKLIPDAHPRPFAGLQSTFPAWSLIRYGLLRTQQDSRRHPRHAACLCW